MNLDHLDMQYAQGKPEPKPVCICVVRHTPKLTIYNSNICPVHRGQAERVGQAIILEPK